jgi:hypothetical protein
LLGARPLCPLVVRGVGLLVEIWIVDASIKFFFLCSCVECASPAWCAGCPSGWWVGWVGGVCDKL